MIHCHVCLSTREAVYRFAAYVEENIAKLDRIDRVNLRVLDKDGNTHYFVSRFRYNKWCLGRTYMLRGELYHSGERYMRGEE